MNRWPDTAGPRPARQGQGVAVQGMDIAMAETLNPVPFWFLRHGETDWNARMLSQGRVDIPLNSVGLAQAGRAAEALVGKGIRSIHASTLTLTALDCADDAERWAMQVTVTSEDGAPLAWPR